ncbi:MAG: hypothetical protein Q4G49_03065 [Paracoccus sp. (in: a-proteobacteria)]|nr:hypothetical protein [Paracoccus sp. (in: a-proteobacteria)]
MSRRKPIVRPDNPAPPKGGGSYVRQPDGLLIPAEMLPAADARSAPETPPETDE